MEKEKKDAFQYSFVAFTVACFVAVLILLSIFEVPEGNRSVVYAMTGVLGTIAVGSSHFITGSTKGSQQKDEIIAKNEKNA